MDFNKYMEKLKLVFDRFTENGFHINGHYAKAILNHLECCPEKSIERYLLETTEFSNLVISALINVEKIPCKAVITFLVEIVTLLFKKESLYCKLIQTHGFHTILSNIDALNETVTSPAFQLAYVKLQTAQILHNNGVLNIIKRKMWTHLLTSNTHRKPLSVANAVYGFIEKLVWKLDDYEEDTVIIEVLQYILNPMGNNEYFMPIMYELDVESDKHRSEQIISYLRAVRAIYNNPKNYIKSNKPVHLMRRNFFLQGHLQYITIASRDKQVLILTIEILFRYYFATFRANVVEEDKSNNFLLHSIITTFTNLVNSFIHKNCLSILLSNIVSCVVFWSEIDSTVIPWTFELNGQIYDIGNQFITLLVAPILTFASRSKDGKTQIDSFFLKLTMISTEHVVKCYYQYKEYIETTDIKKTCLHGLEEVFKLKGHLNTSQAGIIYQALYYVLNSYVCMDGSGDLILGDSLKSTDDLKILTYVLDLMLMLIKEYEINWYESFEIIYFQNTLVNVLKQQFLPTKILLQALSLIDWSIKKFLSPDLQLLVNFKNGSTMEEIGKEIRTFLTHEEWEIKDSALQIIMTCTEVSYIKYLPLQKLISEYDLIVEAASIAKNCNENYYVQASALRCLAVATKIENIWTNILSVHPQLYVELIGMLQNNSEGIVRKEAAHVLIQLYINQSLSQSSIQYLYTVMSTAAINDLHWEVQLSALIFWKHVIHTHLSDKGMIDGKFPAVTFSKEKRKIIVLDSTEITKQLILLMDQLSSNGCLTVLQYCLDEDCSVSVLELAYSITKDLIQILDAYKMSFSDFSSSSILPELIEEFNKSMEASVYYEEPHAFFDNTENYVMEKRDAIIDEILAKSTASLILDGFMNNNDNTGADVAVFQPQSSQSNQLRQINIVNPSEFVANFKNKDYEIIISKRRNCYNDNLNALLDEIIFGQSNFDFGLYDNNYCSFD